MSGPYQVQAAANPVTGPWQDIGGPRVDPTVSLPTTGAAVFYRVVSLRSQDAMR